MCTGKLGSVLEFLLISRYDQPSHHDHFVLIGLVAMISACQRQHKSSAGVQGSIPLDAAAREMNRLPDWAGVLAKDWVK